MKKTTKNPITFFREANEKRRATVKNSLKKAQKGMSIERPSMRDLYDSPPLDPYYKSMDPNRDMDPGIIAKGPNDDFYRNMDPDFIIKSPNDDFYRNMDPEFSVKGWNRDTDPGFTKTPKGSYRDTDPDFFKTPLPKRSSKKHRNPLGGMEPYDIITYKKGGSAKPSAGLSAKTKSNIAKKASAGKDIGKKGKGFAKVAAAAGGGEKGKRIAAAAMWKNIKRG